MNATSPPAPTRRPPAARGWRRAAAHVHGLWAGPGYLLPVPFLAWQLWWIAAYRELRLDHLGTTLLAFGLAWGTSKTKQVFLGMFPIGLLGLLYDTMKFVQNVGVSPERVHVCDLRAMDMRIWPVDLGGGTIGTPHDWFRVHHSTALDLLCAVPYGTFIVAIMVLVVYFYFKDQSRMYQLGWTFFTLNLAGFITYHLLPAAPPWYFHEHGCVVDMAAKASEGVRLAHVDQLLGYGYFASIYGRASDVFGALPSLHVAYALLIVLCGFRVFGPVLRVISILYFALMCFGAVYLDHHWIVDILLGIVYTLVVYPAVRAIQRAVARRTRLAPAPREQEAADGA